MTSRRARIERAIELRLVQEHEADLNYREAVTVAVLVDALDEVPTACVLVGSIVAAKFQREGNAVLICRSLTEDQARALERFPEVQSVPERFFDLLGVAMSKLDPQALDRPAAGKPPTEPTR